MKRWVHASQDANLTLNLDVVTSITLVDNVFEFDPRNHQRSISIESANQIRDDYSSMTREQLLSLPRKDLDAIQDITVLRKLKVDELNLAQKLLVARANSEYRDESSPAEVKQILQKIKECKTYFIWRSAKNDSFAKEVEKLGGEVDNSDLRKIVRQLDVSDFTEFRLSYLDVNWNSLLIVLEYRGSYTFKALEDDGEPVTVTDLDLYIKIDVDNIDGRGVGAMSFHHPEFKMKHPYTDNDN